MAAGEGWPHAPKASGVPSSPLFFFFFDANVVAAKTEAPVGGLVNVAEEQRDNVRADFGATL